MVQRPSAGVMVHSDKVHALECYSRTIRWSLVLQAQCRACSIHGGGGGARWDTA